MDLTWKLISVLDVSVDRKLCVKYDVEQAILFKKFQNMIKMASNFASSVATGFQGNVHEKTLLSKHSTPTPPRFLYLPLSLVCGH